MFPSVITSFPLFFSFILFYLFFKWLPSYFLLFLCSIALFRYYFDLTGLNFEYPFAWLLLFLNFFYFLYITKSQPSSKLILHSFKVCFSQAPSFCVSTLPTDLHQQFKPDDIMIPSLVFFYSNLIYHVCIISKDKV